jgi:hypothetical protein
LDKNQLDTLPPIAIENLKEALDSLPSPEQLTLDVLRDFGLRTGVLLFEDGLAIGACELLGEQDVWQVRKIKLIRYANYASLFMALLRSVIAHTWQAKAIRIEAQAYDDINQPRSALPERYDYADIGYASYYARAGFRRFEPIPGSKWIISRD